MNKEESSFEKAFKGTLGVICSIIFTVILILGLISAILMFACGACLSSC